MLLISLSIATMTLGQFDSTQQVKPQGEVSSGLQYEGVKKAQFDEVERGFSFRIPVGVVTWLTPVKNNASGVSRNYDPGIITGFEVGYDIAKFIDLGGFFYYAQTPERNGLPTYDLNTFFGGAMGRFSFYTTKRLFVGARVGVGYGTQDDTVERRQQAVSVIGGGTIEYYTNLRHFSISFDVQALVWTAPVAVALSFMPAVRYTF